MVRFIIGDGEPRRVSFVSNLPDEVLEKFFDAAKDVFSEDIKRFLDESVSKNSVAKKLVITPGELAELLRVGGFPCKVEEEGIVIFSGESYRNLPSNQYVGRAHLKGNNVKIDTVGTEQSGAIDNVADYLAKRGLSVGTYSSDVKSKTRGS